MIPRRCVFLSLDLSFRLSLKCEPCTISRPPSGGQRSVSIRYPCSSVEADVIRAVINTHRSLRSISLFALCSPKLGIQGPPEASELQTRLGKSQSILSHFTPLIVFCPVRTEKPSAHFFSLLFNFLLVTVSYHAKTWFYC